MDENNILHLYFHQVYVGMALLTFNQISGVCIAVKKKKKM